MTPAIVKRSVRIAGHSTSVSLEPEFWTELIRIARTKGLSLNAIVGKVDASRHGNLSSALRVLVLHELKSAVPRPE